MTKAEVIETVKEMEEAPSCCDALKKAAQDYLASPGKAQAETLIQEMKKDITTIDALIALSTSERGRHIFGAAQAKVLEEKARAHKAEGGRYCICPACQSAAKLLDHQEDI